MSVLEVLEAEESEELRTHASTCSLLEFQGPRIYCPAESPTSLCSLIEEPLVSEYTKLYTCSFQNT